MTLTPQQLEDLVEKYCNRVVDEMSRKDLEQHYFELLLDSFAHEDEKDVESLICSIYDESYYEQLVKEVTGE
jgi:hypothetical protein